MLSIKLQTATQDLDNTAKFYRASDNIDKCISNYCKTLKASQSELRQAQNIIVTKDNKHVKTVKL